MRESQQARNPDLNIHRLESLDEVEAAKLELELGHVHPALPCLAVIGANIAGDGAPVQRGQELVLYTERELKMSNF